MGQLLEGDNLIVARLNSSLLTVGTPLQVASTNDRAIKYLYPISIMFYTKWAT